MARLNRQRRSAAMSAEMGFVFPILLTLVFGLIVGGMGVFRYQQVACMAHEASRYTAVRGIYYQNDTGLSSPTSTQIFQSSVVPMLVGMDQTQMTITVQLVDQGTNTVSDWDQSTKAVKSINALGEYVTNTVRVTITYQWTPGLFFGSTIMTSVSEIPMQS